MKTRLFVYAAVAFLAGAPAIALATPSVQATVPATVAAGSTVPVTCYAEGKTATSLMQTSESMQYVDVTVEYAALVGSTAGTLAATRIPGPAVQSSTCVANGTSCNVIQGAVNWTAPADPGSFTVTCTATYLGGFGGTTTLAAAGAATFDTTAGAPVAPVVSGISGPIEVVTGASAALSVTASDPNGLALTYAWTATCGAVTAGSDPSTATWQAPATPGSCDVTVTVSNGTASTPATKKLNAVIAAFQASLPVPLDAPRRLAASQDGFAALYVVDGRQFDVGRVSYLNVRGEVRGFVTVPEPAVAVAQGAGSLWVTTAPGNLFRLDSASGRIVAKLPLVDLGRPLLKPLGVVYEPSRMTLWVAELDAGRVRILRPDGTPVAELASAGANPLGGPVDVALDEAGGKVWVLDQEANAAGLFLHAYDLDGNYLASYLDSTGLSRGGGVGVGPDGHVYVTDSFQGVVQVLDRSGAFVGTIGTFGENAGQLIAPCGIAAMANGDVAVATPTNGQVERFGTGVALPATCMVNGKLDSDCDGLSDEWEVAHGLNPLFAGDALLAFGNSGLNNYEVASYQSSYGTDPWTPPTVSASAPAQTGPGLVKMFATPSGPPNYSVSTSWRFVDGPAAVALRNASTISPSFIARTPGLYKFEVVGATSLATGTAAQVSVTVKNVAPVAEAGRVVVAATGAAVKLDGGLSSDANGDALSYTWDQTFGAALTASSPGAAITVRPRTAGLYKFLLTATDGGLSSSVEVPVLVQGQPTSTAIALATPAVSQVGQAISLDGTASLFADPAPGFVWEQIDGAPATLGGANQPVATFVPAAAGRYAFALTVVTRDGRRSPPARVDVFVAEAGRTAPEIQAASAEAGVVDVNTPVALTASGTGSGYAWRQVSGPAAGLTDADQASATAVAFSPGWYVFEVAAVDGAAVGPPWRVSFEARANGQPIPVARIATPGTAPVAGQLVFLDGRASTGAARFRWTQVGGPWVVLSAQGAVTMFRPHDPGTYAFELEVDDGRVRSAPARVEINVSENGVN